MNFVKKINKAADAIWKDPEIIPLIGFTVGTVTVAIMHLGRTATTKIDYSRNLKDALKKKE